MRLVVNSDRVIAALIRDSKCRQILLSGKFEFLSIDFAKLEIQEHQEEILQKTGLSNDQFNAILETILDKIVIVKDTVVKGKMNQARKVMDRIDPDDTPFIALALATENDGIWTEDKHFEKQKSVRTWKTVDLLSQIDGN